MKMRKYFKVLNAKSFQAIENNIFKKQLVHKNRILFNLKPYHIPPPPPYVVIKVFNYGGGDLTIHSFVSLFRLLCVLKR